VPPPGLQPWHACHVARAYKGRGPVLPRALAAASTPRLACSRRAAALRVRRPSQAPLLAVVDSMQGSAGELSQDHQGIREAELHPSCWFPSPEEHRRVAAVAKSGSPELDVRPLSSGIRRFPSSSTVGEHT
jgi:hypothetical protein